MRLFFIYFVVFLTLLHHFATGDEKNVGLSELERSMNNFQEDIKQIEKIYFEINKEVKKQKESHSNPAKKNDINVDLLEMQLKRQQRLLFHVSAYILDPRNKDNGILKERKLVLSSWLEYHNHLLDIVDPKHDPLKLPTTNISPGKGTYSAGIAPESIKEPDIRKEYEKKLEENAEYAKNFNLQCFLNDAIFQSLNKFREVAIKNYSLSPHADDELLELLDKYEYPEAEKVKIYKALNIPYKGFREWRTNDGLLTLTAKLISADKKEVKLEKEDGKKFTIEIAYLRKEDQDYIKRQLEPKPEPKTPTDKKTND
jgi:hypothetical protein